MTVAQTSPSKFFVTGGALSPDSASYVKRPVDDALFDLALAGEFCYGLTARQMGKSSLMHYTARRLEAKGVRIAVIDLTTIGSDDVSVEQWYLGLLTHLKAQLSLAVDLESWWKARAALGVVQRFITFLQDVVLEELKNPVVIFIDEIDITLSLSFADDFFAAIRSVYNARATNPLYQRLTFVLFGVATPGDLIKDRSRTPFNIGHRLDLREFSRTEAQDLEQGLQAVYPDQSEAIFNRIFYWTNGHPYLTQKLCRLVAESDHQTWTETRIDRLVEKLFLSEEARSETNLQFVRDNIQASPRRRELLELYRQVYEGKAVPEDERSIDQNRLQLWGLVRVDNGLLEIRNEIYRRAFNLEWIKTNTPKERIRQIIQFSVGLTILLIIGIGLVLYRQQQQTVETRAATAIEDFSIPSAEVRLNSLAELLRLPGYADSARELFYGELDSGEQQDMFTRVDPTDLEVQLVTVIEGLYVDPRIKDSADQQLLAAMLRSLSVLDDDGNSPATKNLTIEIKKWLDGQEALKQNDPEQAIIAYNAAIGLNDENPGTYFDRARAYASFGKSDLALADLVRVLNLNEAWQERVRQMVISDDVLYVALWSDRREYQAIAGLIPTPTPTATQQSITRFQTAEIRPSSTPTETPIPLPGITRVRSNDNAIMVYVPKGEFTIGSSEEDNQAEDDEKPQTTIILDSFWIDRYEVTNASYKKFVDATNYHVPFIDASWADRYNWIQNTYPQGLADYPVMLVDWNDASAYCSWAGGRLPTEAEWEIAARGTDNRKYPWGDKTVSCETAVVYDGSSIVLENEQFGCGRDEPWPVGSKPSGVSPYGALDMVGNVWEWTASLYRNYPYDPNDGRESPDASGLRVVRGGSWDDPDIAKRVRPAYRLAISHDSRNRSLGFRCAMSAIPSVTITLTPTPTPVPTSIALPTQMPTQEIIPLTIETFDDNKNGWPTPKNSLFDYHLVNGEYYMTTMDLAPEFFDAVACDSCFVSENFTYQAQTRIELIDTYKSPSASDDALKYIEDDTVEYGLAFNINPEFTSFYYLLLQGSNVIFGRFANDSRNVIGGPQMFSSITVGPEAYNKIRVACYSRGDTGDVILFINNESWNTFTIDEQCGGRIGLVRTASLMDHRRSGFSSRGGLTPYLSIVAFDNIEVIRQ